MVNINDLFIWWNVANSCRLLILFTVFTARFLRNIYASMSARCNYNIRWKKLQSRFREISFCFSRRSRGFYYRWNTWRFLGKIVAILPEISTQVLFVNTLLLMCKKWLKLLNGFHNLLSTSRLEKILKSMNGKEISAYVQCTCENTGMCVYKCVYYLNMCVCVRVCKIYTKMYDKNASSQTCPCSNLVQDWIQ